MPGQCLILICILFLTIIWQYQTSLLCGFVLNFERFGYYLNLTSKCA